MMGMPEELWNDSYWSEIRDAHCHITDSMNKVEVGLAAMKTSQLTLMSTRLNDQELVERVAQDYGNRIRPSFGYHPWFTHMMWLGEEAPICKEDHYRSVLTPEPTDQFTKAMPEPVSWNLFAQALRARLERFPLALVGEIGVDRSFRIPDPFREATTSKRTLSKYKVCPEHQVAILEAQVRIAAEYKRSISVHDVHAHGAILGLFQRLWAGFEPLSKAKLREHRHPEDVAEEMARKQPFPTNICMHSYSGAADNIKPYISLKVPSKVFFSFSIVINSRYADWAEKVKAVPDNRLLVESDLHDASLIDQHIQEAIEFLAQAKGWSIEDTVHRLHANHTAFLS